MGLLVKSHIEKLEVSFYGDKKKNCSAKWQVWEILFCWDACDVFLLNLLEECWFWNFVCSKNSIVTLFFVVYVCVCEWEKKEENVLRTKNVENRKDFTQLSSLIQRNKKRRKPFYEYIININLKVNLTKLQYFHYKKINPT